VASIPWIEAGEASRRRRIVVKEPATPNKRRGQPRARGLRAARPLRPGRSAGCGRHLERLTAGTGPVARRDIAAGLGTPQPPVSGGAPRSRSPAALGEAPPTARKTRVRIPAPPLLSNSQRFTSSKADLGLRSPGNHRHRNRDGHARLSTVATVTPEVPILRVRGRHLGTPVTEDLAGHRQCCASGAGAGPVVY